MDRHLADFLATWLRVATMAMVPVVLTAFVSIPYALGGHPGEPLARTAASAVHMT